MHKRCAGSLLMAATPIAIRVSGVLILPAVVMVGLAWILPNPDGALTLALFCMSGANYWLKQ